jgi:tetratricopeptide (TPR) repeat protein
MRRRLPHLSRIVSALLLFGVTAVDAQLETLEAERAKNFGIAHLEQEQPNDAAEMFRTVIDLAPEEALGYANLAATFLRLSQVDSALHWLDQANVVALRDPRIYYLKSEAYGAASRWGEALDALNRAIAISPDDAILRFARFRTIQSLGDDLLRAVATEDIARLVALVPENPVVRVKHAKERSEAGDFSGARGSYTVLKPLLEDAGVQPRVVTLVERGLDSENSTLAVRGFTVLENVLRPSERYKQSLGQLQNPVIGLPFLTFSEAFRSNLRPEIPNAVYIAWRRLKAVSVGVSGDRGSLDFADVDGDGTEDWLVSIDGDLGLSRIHRSGSGDFLADWLGPGASVSKILDYDNDGHFDVLGIGGSGIWLAKGGATRQYADVTVEAELTSPPAQDVAVIDLDNEGDLDLAVAASDAFHAWQNRMDGRFLSIDERIGIQGFGGIRAIVPFDHDDDGDTDLVVVDRDGRLQLLDNLRLSRFEVADRGFGEATYTRVVPADIDNDGWLDLVLLTEEGDVTVRRWRSGLFASDLPVSDGPIDQLGTGDVDNDGWMDVLMATGDRLHIARNDGQGGWLQSEVGQVSASVIALGVTDTDADGDLDLVALTANGTVETFKNEGGNANGWLRISLVGLQTRGTKNNLHGYGSRVEVKAGLHYQVQYADRPVTHFGLGSRTQADLVRVTWSNGVPQNVFRPASNQTLREKQVLKGSCPYLYVWDGQTYRFVTDLLGAAPLGLQLADGVIAPDNPREILKIDAEMMALKDGQYVFQFTEELWETIYLDEVGLWVVDHPEGVEAFTDERFLPPPYTAPEIVTTRSRRYAKKAMNTEGEEVTSKLRAYDYQYPNTFQSTRYQGLVEPHVLTMEFGDVSTMQSPTLVMRGWIFWSDTSINVNLSQGDVLKPDFPMIDVWRDGEWATMDRPFGLPKGKDKWIVLDLAGEVDPKDARVRIRTNYEIYYDMAFVSDAVSDAGTRITRLKASSAELRYGGFSEMYRPAPDGPHLYDYSKKVSIPLWKDMTGYATKYGDVTSLLEETDDLMAVFTAGDEITIRFEAEELPDLAPGMTRSFFFLSDGWDKDSDRNTVTGDTVFPLPFHGMSAYPYPNTEAFPDSEAHKRMIRETLTRWIGPDAYRAYVREGWFSKQPAVLPWEETEDIAEGGVE